MIPVYFVIYVFTHSILSVYIPLQDEGFYVEASSRLISVLHTFYICLFSFSNLFGYISLEYFLTKIYYTRSYLIYDLLLVTYFRRYYKDYKTIIFHHVAFLTCLNLLTDYTLLPLGLIAETTNFFLHPSWMLYKLNMSDKYIFKIVSTCLYLSFFIFRILNFLYILYIVLNEYNKHHMFEIISLVAIYILNLNWFRILTIKFNKILTNKFKKE
jgi:hypothetical protein